LRIDDVTLEARYIQVSANTRSELALPLIFRNDILGVLNVESEQVAAYTENDEEMLGTLAGSLAAIIANARLVEQIRKQAERERLLFEITSKIRRSTDMQTILSTTINEIQRATGARRTRVTLGTKKNDALLVGGEVSADKE
jgi:sigma-B regulation protein RsbU (phosphoserine phosphatase)